MSSFSKLALFAGGTLFGSIGLKLLTSKDAKNAYVHVAAAGLRAKDSIMETVTTVQENAADILAAAKDLNEDRAAKEAQEAEDALLITEDDDDLLVADDEEETSEEAVAEENTSDAE